MSIWRWAELLDAVPVEHQLTLGEGDTPLIRSRSIGPAHGMSNLYFKLENVNPAGSFKDRFGASAISHMLANAQRTCIATSSGNTGSAVAAYAAAAGLACRIAVVETAPAGKLRQMLAYGAEILRVRSFGLDPLITQDTFETLQRVSAGPDAALQVSSYIYSPAGMSGVETIAFELSEQLERAEHVFCPAGGGGLCLAVALGYEKLIHSGRVDRRPAIECVQPEGNDTIAGPLRRGEPRARTVESTTEISGLQVANVNDGHLVIEHCRPTGGSGHLVADEHVWAVQKRLAQEEGVFTEPAGAVALAGAIRAVEEGRVARDSAIVCLITGSGFKDEASVERMLAHADAPLVDLVDLDARLAGPQGPPQSSAADN